MGSSLWFRRAGINGWVISMGNFVIAVVALEANLERGLCGGSLAVVVKTALVETGVLGIVTCAE